MQFLNLAEQAHLVNILPPHDADTVKSPVPFSLKNATAVNIILGLGVTGAAATITLEACADLAASGNVAIPFDYYAETTAAGDTLGSKQAATAAGFATSTNDNIFYVLKVDAAALPAGKPVLRLVVSDPGAATFVCAFAVLLGLRYQGDQNATAIA